MTVASDEEIVGGQVLQFRRATQRAGDEVAQQPALEGLRRRRGGSPIVASWLEDAEKFSGGYGEFAGKDEGRLAVHRGALGDHPPTLSMTVREVGFQRGLPPPVSVR